MAGLGLLVVFSGYVVANLGWYMVKGRPVSVSELTLPSKRPQALAKIKPVDA